MNALPKGKTEPQVNDGILDRKQGTEKGRNLIPHSVCLGQVAIKLGDEPGPHLKSMDCAGTGQNALGERVRLGIQIKNLGLMASFEGGDHAHGEDIGGSNAQRDKRQLPLRSERNNECSDESGQSLKRQAELLRDAALNKSTVGCSLCSNRTSSAEIEIGYFLAESGPDISMADIAYDPVANIGQEGVVYVREDKSANPEVDKIEARECMR